VDEQGATDQIAEDADIVQRLLHELCFPAIISKRPVWDTFPGAWHSTAVDVIMPNGRTLQVATYHHYQDQWARAFDLTYEDSNGDTQFCHQTTFGMSERLLGAVVGMHGDDNGLIMPPSIAPIQVILMPVAAHADENVKPKIEALATHLERSGFRVRIDDRDLRPGTKHYDWEIKGVPIRLELGPRDLASNQCTLSLRTGGKTEVPIEGISSSISQCLETVSEELRNRSHAQASELIRTFPGVTQSTAGWQLDGPLEDDIIYELAFDGNDADAEVLEKLTGLTLLGDCVPPYTESIPCAVTGTPTTRRQHLARMY
jgi:prolyl-tRNA synthetase